jgi:D-alanyl-lipoteichoic acid acyltransferase DltB (MBOAT superfamily)
VDSFHRARAETGFLAYATFIAFFPHLIAGPIVRPAEILPQLTAPALARPDAGNLTEGLTRFLLGLAKKLVLADSLARYADPGFDAAGAGARLSLLEAWVSLLAYALQLYFDFSGYSDMAIGLARMLNVRFPENFASPYQATSIGDFWRRWHISLGAFLRDYLYIPLGGSRRGKARHAANLMLTMLLGGLWHGAAWTFVLWGGLHGAFLVAEAAWRRRFPPLPRALARGLTLLGVLLAWVPFRAESLAASGAMYAALAGANGFALPDALIAAFPALGLLAAPVPVLAHLGDARTLAVPEAALLLALGWGIALALPNTARMSPRARAAGLVCGFALTAQALFLAPHATPFLYFRF